MALTRGVYDREVNRQPLMLEYVPSVSVAVARQLLPDG